MFDANPYAPPVDSAPGHYEWPLWRRIMYACSMIAIVYLLAAVIGLWQAWDDSQRNPNNSIVEEVVAFLTNWDDR